jgi:hypothetical protein
MKLADIIEGQEYWVSINENQVEVLSDYQLEAHMLLSHAKRSLSGIRARVLEVGVLSPGGRRYVRVEVTSPRPRPPLEYIEDNLDGSRTHWRGYVVDANGDSVEDEEETFTALIAPQQVNYGLTEGIVQNEARHLDVDWRLQRWLADG